MNAKKVLAACLLTPKQAARAVSNSLWPCLTDLRAFAVEFLPFLHRKGTKIRPGLRLPGG